MRLSECLFKDQDFLLLVLHRHMWAAGYDLGHLFFLSPVLPQKFRAVWAWLFFSQLSSPSPEVPPSWRRRVRMLTRRWWTPLLCPPSCPLSFSLPSSVSEHSCTACCSSTCAATGELQFTDITLEKKVTIFLFCEGGLTCRGSFALVPSSVGENHGLKIFSQITWRIKNGNGQREETISTVSILASHQL